MPGQQPGHHGQWGVLKPLGPALDWFEQRPGAGFSGPHTFWCLLTGTEPFLVLRVALGVLLNRAIIATLLS